MNCAAFGRFACGFATAVSRSRPAVPGGASCGRFRVVRSRARCLANPVHAGACVYGRRRQEATIANGRKQLRKGIVKAADEWTVLLHDRREGYVDWEEHERNRAMIEANTVGNRGAPGGGRALLAGLVRCGHCRRRMQARDNGKAVGCSCPGTSGTGGPACIAFGAVRVDEAVRDAVLRAVQPLGVAAALEAFETRDADATAGIRLAGSALEQARYRAARAQSRFDSVDPDNHNVFHNLAARWEACLEEVRSCEERLQDLESAESRPPTAAERDAWLALGADPERAWSHEEATPQLRRNIVRAALVEITASLRERHVHLLLHWQGGDHTEITIRRNRTGEHRCKTDRQTDDLITDPARNPGDELIAGLLNRLGKKTSKGNSWNKDRVRAFRSRRRIAACRDGERRERNELVLSEVASRLEVDPSAVRRLIAVGLLPARQACKGAPWIIDAGDLDSPRIAAALAGRRVGGEARPAVGRGSSSLPAAFAMCRCLSLSRSHVSSPPLSEPGVRISPHRALQWDHAPRTRTTGTGRGREEPAGPVPKAAARQPSCLPRRFRCAAGPVNAPAASNRLGPTPSLPHVTRSEVSALKAG